MSWRFLHSSGMVIRNTLRVTTTLVKVFTIHDRIHRRIPQTLGGDQWLRKSIESSKPCA
jgi:hypothetical protein